MTNYERIKNMSVEEMASILSGNIFRCDLCICHDFCDELSDDPFIPFIRCEEIMKQ